MDAIIDFFPSGQKNPHEGQCPLCNKFGILRESHIISKFLCKKVKGQTNQNPNQGDKILLQLEFDKKLTSKTQDGPKEYLLCGDCEQFFGAAEREFSQIFYNSLPHWTLPRDEDTALTHGMKFNFFRNKNGRTKIHLIHRFALGLVFRLHLCSTFTDVKLNPIHFNYLKNKLLRDISNQSHDDDFFMFPCVFFKISHNGTNPGIIAATHGYRENDMTQGLSHIHAVTIFAGDVCLIIYFNINQAPLNPTNYLRIARKNHFHYTEIDIKNFPDFWNIIEKLKTHPRPTSRKKIKQDNKIKPTTKDYDFAKRSNTTNVRLS